MIKIEHVDQIGGTPIIAFAVKAWMDELQAGLIDDTVQAVNWDDRAAVAYEDVLLGPVGIITYSKSDWLKKTNIKLGYVRPEHRQRGVYRKLWDALVVKSRELGMLAIDGSTHVDNSVMRKVAERLGRTEHSINLSFKLQK